MVAVSWNVARARRSGSFVVLAALFAGNPFLHAQGIPGPRPAPRPPRVFHVPAEFATIQSAIDTARDGDTVVVAPGAYVGHVDFLGKAIEVVAPAGPKRTRLSPPDEGAVVRFHAAEGPDSRLIGFTITGGDALVSLGLAGGVSCMDPFSDAIASPYLSDCVISGNSSILDFGGYGPGGIAGNATLERCVLRNNVADNYGAASGAQGVLTLLQCVVELNTGCRGGGLGLLGGSLVQECVIRDNRAGPCGNRYGPLDAPGGGVWAETNTAVLERCLLVGNGVSEWTDFEEPGSCLGLSRGGAVAGQGTLRRCTIVGNLTEGCGARGGIDGGSTLVDCIVRANEDEPRAYAHAPFRFSDVDVAGAPGPGCFDADPLLARDFRPSAASPCIDRGDPASPPDPDGTRADVGAFYRPQGRAPAGVVWSERKALVSSSPADQRVGRAVAASGDTLLVGAPGDDWMSTPGVALVFRRASGTWSEDQRLAALGSIATDGFGRALDVEGNVAVVAAPALRAPDNSEGTVLVYERPTADAPFVETARLSCEIADADARFGSAVALDGAYLAVGADWHGTGGLGRAFLFHRVHRGKWERVATFEPLGQLFDWGPEMSFGAAVALDGTTLVVGAPFGGAPDLKPGAAFVYEHAGRSPHAWVFVTELAPDDPVGSGGFGGSISLSADTLVVGSHSGAQTFERRGPGLPWQPAQLLLQPGFVTPGRTFAAPTVLVEGDRLWLTRRPSAFDHPGGAIHEFVRANAGAPWFETAQLGPETWREPAPLAFAEGTLFVGRALAEPVAPGGMVRLFARGPEADTVTLDQAADLDPIVIKGRDLDQVASVRIDGLLEPIVAQSATELVIRPARRAPGFSDLMLETKDGAVTLWDGLRSAPTLAASTDGLGGTLDVELVNGAHGNYALSYSLDLRASPLTIKRPPTYYGLWLYYKPGASGRLALDAFDTSGRAVRSFLVPDEVGLTGMTLYLQARCRRGVFGPGSASYTNFVSVTL